ncbi:MAG TPA: hypothetical protein VMB50_15265, partial [Myxococcales bacterium]|nr:hypothetical protein [Myxococcales bacterium]
GSLAMGPVELSGRVQAMTEVKAPFSGQPCVWCRWEKWVVGSRGGGPVEAGALGVHFRLDDGTGSVAVDLAGVAPAADALKREVVPLASGALVQTRGVEYTLREGTTVFVAGVAQLRGPSRQAFPAAKAEGIQDDEALGERLARLKHDPEGLRHYGLTPGEELTAERWEKIVAAVRAEPPQPVRAAVADPEIFIGAGEGMPLLVSGRSREETTRELSADYWRRTVLGTVLLTFALIATGGLVWRIAGATPWVPSLVWSLGESRQVRFPRTQSVTVTATLGPSCRDKTVLSVAGQGFRLALMDVGQTDGTGRHSFDWLSFGPDNGGTASCKVAAPGSHRVVGTIARDGTRLDVDGSCVGALRGGPSSLGPESGASIYVDPCVSAMTLTAAAEDSSAGTAAR